MGSPLDSAQFVRLLKENLREVAEKTYNELPSMIPTIYRTINSDSAWEEFYSVGAVPDIPEFNGKISYLGIAPGYHVKIEPKEYAGGIQSERKLIDDKKYAVLDSKVAGLMTAAGRTREKSGVRTFSNAFSSAYDFQTSEEGLSLCNSSHTTKSGTSTSSGFDNSGTSALNKSSLAATRILMRQFRNDISERIDIGDSLGIICPDNLVETAWEIVNTQKGYDTAAQTANYQANRYQIIPYLRLDDSDSNNWYLVDLNKMKESLVWVERIMP
ncbi:MAG: Mu-like prophage major head subunit gpT family protein, partial [Planctomycetota bacterium]